MQIPTLIKSIRQRMLNVTVVQSPGTMDHFSVLLDLLRCQRWTTFNKAMRSDGHDIRRAIGQPDTGARKRHLHHVLCKVTSLMQHVLVRRGDVAAGRVIVSTKVCGDTAPSPAASSNGRLICPR